MHTAAVSHRDHRVHRTTATTLSNHECFNGLEDGRFGGNCSQRQVREPHPPTRCTPSLRRSPLDDLTTFTCYSLECSEAGFFRRSPTVFKISRENASSDTAGASAIAPTSALRVKIALDVAARLSSPGGNPTIS